MASMLEWKRERAQKAIDDQAYRLATYLNLVKSKYDLDLWDHVFTYLKSFKEEV